MAIGLNYHSLLAFRALWSQMRYIKSSTSWTPYLSMAQEQRDYPIAYPNHIPRFPLRWLIQTLTLPSIARKVHKIFSETSPISRCLPVFCGAIPNTSIFQTSATAREKRVFVNSTMIHLRTRKSSSLSTKMIVSDCCQFGRGIDQWCC